MIKVALVLIRDGQRKDFPLAGKSTTVGRAIDCTLRVPTGDVSRKHCEIVVGDRDVTVKDLGSANGTYVNGKRVAESKVAAGDRIQIGPATFVVQINGKPENIAIAPGAPAAPAAPAAKAAPAQPPRPADAKPAAAPAPSTKPGPAKPPTPKPAPGKSAREEQIFELDESDFDLDDALAELDALDVDDDLDSGDRPKPGKK